MLLFGGAVIDHLFFRRSQIFEGHIRAHTHFPADIFHERPHESPPDYYRALVYGQILVGHQSGLIDRAGDAGSPAGGTGAAAVEGQFLRPRSVKSDAAHGAHRLLHGRHIHGRRHIMPVGAAMAGQTGEHESEAVKQLRHGSESASDSRDSGPLVQGQGSRHIADIIHMSPCSLGHPPACVSRERFQIPPGTLSVEHTQGQRRFPGP